MRTLYKMIVILLAVWVTLGDLVIYGIGFLTGRNYTTSTIMGSVFFLLVYSTTVWSISIWAATARSAWGRANLSRTARYTGYIVALVGSLQFSPLFLGYSRFFAGERGITAYLLGMIFVLSVCVSKVAIWRFAAVLANTDQTWPWMRR